MENKMKYNKIIHIFLNPCKQKIYWDHIIIGIKMNWTMLGIHLISNRILQEWQTSKIFEIKNSEKRTTMRERERERERERMTIKPKKCSWHLFNNCGKIIVNLLFVFSTRGAQLFSSYSLLINENFNYSPKVISFLSSLEEFSLAI